MWRNDVKKVDDSQHEGSFPYPDIKINLLKEIIQIMSQK